MLLYMFVDLVNKYSVPCRLITAAPGQYVAGEYIAGSQRCTSCHYQYDESNDL